MFPVSFFAYDIGNNNQHENTQASNATLPSGRSPNLIPSSLGARFVPSQMEVNILSNLPRLTQGQLGLTLDDLTLEQLQLLASRNTQQQAQLAAAFSSRASLLNQLAVIQANSPLAPAQRLTPSSSMGHLVPQLIGGQNVLMASSLSNRPELLQSLIHNNALKERFVALLLSRQQTRMPILNSRMPLQSQVGQLEMLLPSTLSPSNATGLGQPSLASSGSNGAPLQPQVGTQQMELHANPGTMLEACPLLAQVSQATRLALPSNSQLSSSENETASKPAAAAAKQQKRRSQKDPSDVKKRWMMRYKELKKFRQVRKR